MPRRYERPGPQIDLKFFGLTLEALDGRLFVYSTQTESWIARNDDRSMSQVDPLIDAPLTAGGTLHLVVENVAQEASNAGYEFGASSRN